MVSDHIHGLEYLILLRHLSSDGTISNAIPIKFPGDCLAKVDNLSLKFIWK